MGKTEELWQEVAKSKGGYFNLEEIGIPEFGKKSTLKITYDYKDFHINIIGKDIWADNSQSVTSTYCEVSLGSRQDLTLKVHKANLFDKLNPFNKSLGIKSLDSKFSVSTNSPEKAHAFFTKSKVHEKLESLDFSIELKPDKLIVKAVGLAISNDELEYLIDISQTIIDYLEK